MYCWMSFWPLGSGLRIKLEVGGGHVGCVSDQHQDGWLVGIGHPYAVPSEAVNTGDHDGGSLHIMR